MQSPVFLCFIKERGSQFVQCAKTNGTDSRSRRYRLKKGEENRNSQSLLSVESEQGTEEREDALEKACKKAEETAAGGVAKAAMIAGAALSRLTALSRAAHAAGGCGGSRCGGR